MNKPLSVSAYSVYAECPKKYDLQYNKGIKPETQPSYFIFGSAVDKGLNALLSKAAFETALKEFNTEILRLLSSQVEFLSTDYDAELFTDEQKDDLLSRCRRAGYLNGDLNGLIETCREIPSEHWSEKRRKCHAILNHASLQVKGELMLKAYQREILPRLDDVNDVQKSFTWLDDKGNKFTGIIDFTALFEDKRVTADNKTSAPRVYNENSVKTSLQFSAYTSQTMTTHAVYFVLNKAIQKNRIKTCLKCKSDSGGGRHKTCAVEVNGDRCGGEWAETIAPQALVEVYCDEVNVEEQKIVQSAMTDVAESIKKDCYPKNLKSCIQKFGSRESKCPYYNYCRSGSLKGLIKGRDYE